MVAGSVFLIKGMKLTACRFAGNPFSMHFSGVSEGRTTRALLDIFILLFHHLHRAAIQCRVVLHGDLGDATASISAVH